MKKIVTIVIFMFSLCYGEQGKSVFDSGVYPSMSKNIINDTGTNLMWQYDIDTSRANLKNWSEALEFCNSSDFAGYDDWRLPNIFELYSTCDNNKTQPSTTILTNITQNRWSFWTSTSAAYNPEIYAWYIDFSDSLTKYSSKSSHHSVICVRDIDRDKNRTVNAGEDIVAVFGSSVTLSATADDEEDIISMVWKEDERVLSNDFSFSKGDFTLGEHNVTFLVTYNNNKSFSDSVIVKIGKYYIKKIGEGLDSLTYDYDEFGNLKTVIREGSVDSVRSIYNLKGDVIREESFETLSDSNEIFHTNIFHIVYEPNKKIVSADIGNNGTIDKVTAYIYENEKLKYKFVDVDNDGDDDIKYTYNEYEDIIFTEEGVSSTRYILTYNEHNDLIKQEADLGDDGTIDYTDRFEYEYDENGNIKKGIYAKPYVWIFI